MTRWVVIFDDNPEMLDVRRKFGAQHLDYLRANSARILIGGGLRITCNCVCRDSRLGCSPYRPSAGRREGCA